MDLVTLVSSTRAFFLGGGLILFFCLKRNPISRPVCAGQQGTTPLLLALHSAPGVSLNSDAINMCGVLDSTRDT